MNTKHGVGLWRLLCILMCLGAPSVLWAGVPTDQIRETTDKILAILSDPDLKAPERLKERNRQVRQTVDERFDWEEMSRRTLARQWSKRTEAERREFVQLFGNLLEKTYMEKVGNYSGEKVLYEGETLDGDHGSVQVKILTKNGVEIPVAYKVLNKSGKWLIYDIVIEGVSLVNNYRSQFNSMLSSGSFETLLEKLKAKATEG